MREENNRSEKCSVIYTVIGQGRPAVGQAPAAVLSDTEGCSVITEFIDQGAPTGVALAAPISHPVQTAPPGGSVATGRAADDASEGRS